MLPASTVPQSGQVLVSHHCRVSSMTYSLHLNLMIRQMVSRGLVYPLRVSRLTYTAPVLPIQEKGRRGLKATTQRHQQAGRDVSLCETSSGCLRAIHVNMEFRIIEALLDACVGDA